jgi:hypothetical protein
MPQPWHGRQGGDCPSKGDGLGPAINGDSSSSSSSSLVAVPQISYKLMLAHGSSRKTCIWIRQKLIVNKSVRDAMRLKPLLDDSPLALILYLRDVVSVHIITH